LRIITLLLWCLSLLLLLMLLLLLGVWLHLQLSYAAWQVRATRRVMHGCYQHAVWGRHVIKTCHQQPDWTQHSSFSYTLPAVLLRTTQLDSMPKK
jgi:hypothetical protein